MNKTIIKILSIISIALLGISLSACGSKSEVSEEKGDGYAYYPTFNELSIVGEDEYTSGMCVKNGNLYAATVGYDQNDFTVRKNTLHVVDIKTQVDTKKPFEIPNSNAYISDILVDGKGDVSLMLQTYDDETGEVGYSICKFDSDLNLKEEISLEEAVKAANGSYLSRSLLAADGKIYMAFESLVVVADESGKVIASMPLESWPDSLFEDNDGNVLVCTRRESDWALVAKKINTVSKSLDLMYENLGHDGTLFRGQGKDLLLATYESVYNFNPETSEKELLWNWIDVDIQNYSQDGIIANADGTFDMVLRSWNDSGEKHEIVHFEKKPVSTGEKEIITFGCVQLDYNIREDLINFNKKNDKYRVSVKQYYNSNESDDYQAAVDKFNLDAAQGKFDIVSISDLSGAVDLSAKKGILAPLDEYMEKDTSFNKGDYFESALNIGEWEGKIYGISPNFTLKTIVMPKSIADTLSGWEMEDLFALRSKYADKPFSLYGTKTEAFSDLFFTEINDFIDYEKAKCDFNNDKFFDLLKYADSFPENIDYENYDSWEEIQKKNVVLCNMNIADAGEFDLYTQLFGEDLSVVGFPGAKGNGSYISSYFMLGIGDKAKNKEGAWTFISYLLSKDCQTNDYYSAFPVRKESFYDMMEKGMVKEIVGIDGNKQYESQGAWGNGNITVELFGLTQSQVDTITKAIEGATPISNVYDDKLYTIIGEELEPFFKGSKTAEEIANTLQSRINIYLQEQQ